MQCNAMLLYYDVMQVVRALLAAGADVHLPYHVCAIFLALRVFVGC
jgi:hypothetical protein